MHVLTAPMSWTQFFFVWASGTCHKKSLKQRGGKPLSALQLYCRNNTSMARCLKYILSSSSLLVAFMYSIMFRAVDVVPSLHSVSTGFKPRTYVDKLELYYIIQVYSANTHPSLFFSPKNIQHGVSFLQCNFSNVPFFKFTSWKSFLQGLLWNRALNCDITF